MNNNDHILFHDIGVVILAGGRSTRMEQPKCFLPVNNKTLLETTYDECARVSSCTRVVLNAEFTTGQWEPVYRKLSQKMQFILNHHPELGRGFSLQLALATMPSVNYCILQNVDNPVSLETLSALASSKNEAGYTVPVTNGRCGHPILISRRIMNALLNCTPGNFILSNFLKGYSRRLVEVPDARIHINLNSPSDFRDYTQQFLR